MTVSVTAPHEKGLGLGYPRTGTHPRERGRIVSGASCPETSLAPTCSAPRPVAPGWPGSTHNNLLARREVDPPGDPGDPRRPMDIIHQNCAGLDVHKKT